MSARILVVDDEPDIRFLLKDILEDEGYEVDVAEHAHAADEARQRNHPDLVLLDIWMPDVDGVTLLKRWKSSGRDEGSAIARTQTARSSAVIPVRADL